MVLGFKPQFKKPILKKKKKHTIREDKNDRWKPGMKIHFATGVRTKKQRQFKEGVCKSIQKIEIVHHDNHELGARVEVLVDSRSLERNEIGILAINDGFKNIPEFLDWFNKDFSGKIIHWTDLRY